MRKRLLVVVVIAVIVLGAIICSLSSGGAKDATPAPTRTPRPTNTPRPTGTPTPDVSDQWGAIAVCKQFVKEQLVAPSTAKFLSPDRVFQVDKEADTWRVLGSLDAQNKMGAMLRLKYLCDVSYQGEDMWHLVDLDIAEP